MEKKTDSLLFRFSVIFALFALMTLLMCGISIYYTHMNAYEHQCEENVKHVENYLEDLMKAEGQDFINFQDFFIANHERIYVPIDFDGNWQPARRKYEQMLQNEYPDKILGYDVQFDELSDEVKLAFATYKFEYWLSVFDDARDAFGLKYTYYVVPTGEDLHMYYVIDAIRENNGPQGEKYLKLCDDILEPFNEHRIMWEAWHSGLKPKGHDNYDNVYGKTYAYYIPLIINGRKMGVISVDVEIADVDANVMNHTLRQVSALAIVIFASLATLLYVIHHRYIRKLTQLQANIRAYSAVKDPSIAGVIEQNVIGHDEISALSMQIAAMILELESYMTSLVNTAKELGVAREHANAMHKLANRDALTGVRNKNAYDSEIRRLEWDISDPNKQTEFGIAMIDLNFLKRINDTFGHEQGNIAIKKLCAIVCDVFAHSPVFRIGGDEFVVILENHDYDKFSVLKEEFNARLKALEANPDLSPWEKVSASIGIALYNPNLDSSVENVFRRADKAMYIRKKEMKAQRV